MEFAGRWPCVPADCVREVWEELLSLYVGYEINVNSPTLARSYTSCLSLGVKPATRSRPCSGPFSTRQRPKIIQRFIPKGTLASNPESSRVHAALRDDLGLGNDDGTIGSSTPYTRHA